MTESYINIILYGLFNICSDFIQIRFLLLCDIMLSLFYSFLTLVFLFSLTLEFMTKAVCRRAQRKENESCLYSSVMGVTPSRVRNGFSHKTPQKVPYAADDSGQRSPH